jgi:iron complex transport system substrate-binding protein
VLRRSLIVVAALAAALVAAALAPAALPSRIVSLSPTATEDLYAIGAGKQVVAVDQYSDYPKNAPRTQLSGLQPSVEAIASYNPDLVVVSNDTDGIVEALQKVGIDTMLEPAADTIAQAYEEIRQLGAATGHVAGASVVVRTMERQLTAIVRTVPKSRRHLRVFHELDPTYYSATSDTFIGRVYKLFGFTDIADAADTTHSGYPQLSAEYILTANPQLVVLADGVTPKQAEGRPGWGNLAAVKQGRVIEVNEDVSSRWGPRLVDFVRAIAAAARRAG